MEGCCGVGGGTPLLLPPAAQVLTTTAAQVPWGSGWLDIKEDRAEVTLGILIKIPPNFLLNLSLITLHDVPS